MSSSPIVRFAAFKYKPGTTDQQKRKAYDDLLKLYQENGHLVNKHPSGGMNNSTEGFDKGFDVVFTVEFKSAADRDAFVPDEKHLAYKASIMDLIEDAIVYDFTPGVFGY